MTISLNPINLFLVEDNPADVDLTRLALEENNMSVNLQVAYDGEEALDYLQGLEQNENIPLPDLIILDLNIPKINGLELLKIIKSKTKLQSTPVVILTTSDTEADKADCYQHYANCYITKPLDFEEFIEVIREIKAFWFDIATLPGNRNDQYFTH